MKMIMWATDVIDNNIREAHMYAEKAHKLKDVNKAAADWCAKMAKSHLDFNTDGHTVAERMISDYKASGQKSPLEAGMMEVYNAKHADLIAKTAEVKAMLDMYK